MNLTRTLIYANALEIDGTFIRKFSLCLDGQDDDVMLDAAEEFQFTKEQVNAAILDKDLNKWLIHNDAGDSFSIEAFSVSSLTPEKIALNDGLFYNSRDGEPASITVTDKVKDAIVGHFSETNTLYGNCSSIIIDVPELKQLDDDCPFEDDEQSRIELLAAELAAFTEDSQEDMELMLEAISYLEIF